MDRLLDLYGFVSVVLHAAELAARTALLGGVFFWALLLPMLRTRLPGADADLLQGIGRRAVLLGAAAALGAKLAGGGLGLLALAATLETPAAGVLGADFVLALSVALLAVAALGLLALPRGAPGSGRRAALLGMALAVVAASAAGSHAIARTESRPMLLAATALHQAGAALWIGGLPALLAALRLRPETAALVGRRYSGFAAAGVALILLGTVGFWVGYIGEVEAVYGTAYGAMAGTKTALLGLMLLLGLGNFLLLHRMGGTAAALARVRRFVEAETALGLAALALAASLTSVPPAADLPDDRVSGSAIVERFTPAAPRFSSPGRGDLAIPALQAKLDSEWRAREAALSTRPEAFTPGEGLLPPRNAGDIAWSEYSHHWSGLLVLLVGLAALLDSTGKVLVARHWPLLFLLLAAFLAVRTDPEAWPFGEIGLLDSLRDPEVVQHKLVVMLVAGFAVAEWAVRLGWVRGRVRFVFPAAMLAGGLLLLSHTHATANVREALLIELSHLPIAVLAVVGGGARWTELRGPRELSRPAAALWPACLVLIGVLLLIYREA